MATLTDAQINQKNSLANSRNPFGINPNPVYSQAQSSTANTLNNNQTGSLPPATPNEPKVSTTTISNTNKIEAIPGMVKKLDTLTNKGITTDVNGVPRYADGSIYNEPEESKQVTADTADEDASIKSYLDEMKANTDATAKRSIDNIQQKFNQRKSEQEAINQRLQARTNNALLMGGVTGQGSSAQYAPISSQGIISQAESFGVKQLASLDSEEQDLIAQALQAKDESNFKLLEKRLAQVEEKRKEKTDFANKLNDQVLEENKKLLQESIQVEKDTTIADILASGLTEPSAILKKAKELGVSMTAKDVADTLKNIASTLGGGDVSKLSQDVQEYYRLKGEKGGLPVSVLALPSTAEQIAAYIKLKTAAGTKAKSTGSGGSSGEGSGSSSGGTYKSDLDALIGNATNTISTKFGQETFRNSISKARNDGDKISTIATVVLKNSPGPIREDFINQSVGIKQLDKAISLLNEGTKSGRINAATQYTYNLAGKDFDPKLAALNAYIVSAIQPYRNSVTGAAWGNQEENEYQQLFGSTKFSPTELKERLTRVKEILKDKTINALNAQVDPIGSGVNQFETPSVGGSKASDFISNPIPGKGTTYNAGVWSKAK